MKRFCIAALFFCLHHVSFAQDKKHSLSFDFTFANGADFVSGRTLNNAETTYNQTGFFQAGIEYAKSIGKKTSLNYGVEFSSHSFTVITKSFSPGLGAILSEKRKLAIIRLPVTMRFAFWRYCFLQGGLTIDAQIENKTFSPSYEGKSYLNQSGIGSVLNFGLQYPLKEKFMIYTSAGTAYHGLILFSQTGYKQRLLENGLQAGLRYHF